MPHAPLVSLASPDASPLSHADLQDAVARACPAADFRGARVLLVVPDHTRTAPIGTFFKLLFDQIGDICAAFDVIVALGTHPPLSQDSIRTRLDLTAADHEGRFKKVNLFNHAWDDPNALASLGEIPAAEIGRLSQGLFAMDVPVHINRRVFDYDRIIILGPVFPHEVVGFSGGNKYLFPGIAGPEILNFFHWLGAVITNPMIIGHKWTPVRRVVDRAAAMVPLPKLCFCLVVQGNGLVGLTAGAPEDAWDAASDLSAQHHIVLKERPFHTVLSCAPAMYDELWVAGKCMYKLEPVVADGGELIIYAPHLHEISLTHGALIRQIGYHCRDYFLKQWDRFKQYPWGVLAHSTHVRGIGTYEDGVERCRIRVTLATQIPEDQCRAINLGYRDPASLQPAEFEARESDGILCVPKAGERLFHLTQRPAWAG